MKIKPKIGHYYILVNERLGEKFIVRIIGIRNKSSWEYVNTNDIRFKVLKVIKEGSNDYNFRDELISNSNDVLMDLTEEEKEKIMVELL